MRKIRGLTAGLVLLTVPLWAQFSYKLDQSIPVSVNGTLLPLAWAGGLNSAQVNTMDLDGDGQQDLVIFERTANKLFTYLAKGKQYFYAPAYESYFPTGVDQWMLLRDYNGDGKKDIFTSDPNGIKAYVNTTQPNQKPSWRPYNKGIYLITVGFSGNINLQVNSSDVPAIDDLDGDGDLDILVARFVGIGSLEYHRNLSIENTGKADSLQLKRVTQNWGNFEECNCGKFIYGPATTCPTGGRVEHSAGKSLLTIDLDNDGDRDLLFTEESCTNLYLLPNQGTKAEALMNTSTPFPASSPVNLTIFPAGFYEDVTFDGVPDLVVSSNTYSRTASETIFNKTMWLYKNTGTLTQPEFAFVKNDFLQDQMVDVGDNSAPTFFDTDNDGDLDMIVGSYGSEPNTSFFYYENIGTKAEPSFKYITNDYLNFSTHYKGLYNLKPQFADMDSDGKKDFVFTATNQADELTAVYYLQNKNSHGLNAADQPLIATKHTIQQNENVLITDVEQDGFTDLLIGTATGAIEYWVNYGPKGNIDYALKDDSYLGFGISTDRQNVALASGDLNNDGKEELIIGNQRGLVSIVENFRNQKKPVITLTQVIVDENTGKLVDKKLSSRIWPTVANLFFTQYPSILVGNVTGGLQILKNEDTLPLPSEPTLSVYPNPVGQKELLNIQVDRNMTVQFFTLQGQPLTQPIALLANQANSYQVNDLAAGLYVAIFTASNQTLYKKIIIH